MLRSFGLSAACTLLLLTAPMRGAAPPRRSAVVSAVIIRGNRHLSTEHIRNMLRTRPGQAFDAGVLQEDVRYLYSTRQFGNVYADKENDGPGCVKVVIHVPDYPSQVEKVTYQGNVKLSDSDLSELTGVRVGMPCNPMANKIACQRVVQRYNEDGRPFASCELLKGGEVGDTEVVFSITEGPKARIKEIQFKGNTFATAAVLKTHIQSSGMFFGLFGGSYNAAMLEFDQGEVLRYYRSFGFQDVRIGRELSYSTDGREVTVVFHIFEGARSKVADKPQVDGAVIPADGSSDQDNPYKEILKSVTEGSGWR